MNRRAPFGLRESRAMGSVLVHDAVPPSGSKDDLYAVAKLGDSPARAFGARLASVFCVEAPHASIGSWGPGSSPCRSMTASHGR